MLKVNHLIGPMKACKKKLKLLMWPLMSVLDAKSNGILKTHCRRGLANILILLSEVSAIACLRGLERMLRLYLQLLSTHAWPNS